MLDADRFDALTSRIATSVPRRAALGAGLTSLLVWVGRDDAAARKKRRKRKKKTCAAGQTKCGKTCADLATNSANCANCGTSCGGNACINGVCECRAPLVCPSECGCALIVGGAIACTGDITTTACEENEDCPLRSVCRQTGGGLFCSEPCPA